MKTKILLQTTIPFVENDWHIGRFSLLKEHLESLKDANGNTLYDVTARNIEKNADGDDAVLSKLNETDFGEVWLFGVDIGDGLTEGDCEGITKFRQRGGGIFSTRDHQDLGSSLCAVGGIGAAHYFHSKQFDPDKTRNERDDEETREIDFPNYHSGANGDYQQIEIVGEPHELLRKSDGSFIELFPTHPHEGGIGAPENDLSARIIAKGKSQTTGKNFNLIVAFERSTDKHGNQLGRGIAESSFHHLVDYNWNPSIGCPDFVTEKPGDGFQKHPEKLNDVKIYSANLARWLAPSEQKL